MLFTQEEGLAMDTSAFDNLSEEEKAKILAAKTPEEMLEATKSAGYELSLDELDAASGGASWGGNDCPNDCKEHC